MNLVQRVQDILLKPQETWPVIAAEPTDAAAVFVNIVVRFFKQLSAFFPSLVSLAPARG